MSSLKVIQNKPQMPHTDWFRLKSTNVVYRRGPNGLCIGSTGVILPVKDIYAEGYSYDIFDTDSDFVPLYPGDQIVITL